jgi:beta-xylosidase
VLLAGVLALGVEVNATAASSHTSGKKPPRSTTTTSSTTTSSTTTSTTTPPPPAATFPLATENFPDPFVLRVDEASRCGGEPAPCYYAYATEAGFLGFINVPVIRSTDLVNWNWAGPPAPGSTAARKDAMPTLASWVTFGGNWAPSVMFNTTLNKYVMYYTAKSTALGRECVGVATSSAPDGPFVDTNSGPLTCAGPGDNIDPSPFVDSVGGLWLQYTDQNGIQTQRLTANGLTLVGSPTRLLTAAMTWEAGRVEAPSMIQTAQTGILLFYSGNVFTSAGYAVGSARCTTPSSSCARTSPSPVLATRGTTYGPGGQSPFQLPDGSWRLAYHAWVNVVGYDHGGQRTLHISPLTFSGNSPTQNPIVG